MSLRTRRIIFYALVVLFLLSGGGVLLFANGWRLDLETFTLAKTGGIYIESVPPDAEITVGGKPAKNTSGLISSGTLVSGLLPKSYEVTVRKEGYVGWRRTLAVRPALVTQAEHIILVPQKSAAVPLPVPAAKIAVLGGSLATTFADGRITLGSTRLPGTALIALNANGSAAITYDENRAAYLLVPLPEARSSTNLTALFNSLKERSLGLPGTVLPKEVRAHPFDPAKVVVRTERGLYVMDAERLTIARFASAAAPVGAVFARGQSIVWTEYSESEAESALMTADLILRTSARLATIAGAVEKIGESPAGGFLLLTEDGRLLLLPRGAKEAELLEREAADFAAEPDGPRLIVRLRDGALALLDFRDGAKRAALQLVADEVVWHENGAHVFVRRGGAVSFAELFENGEVFGVPLTENAMAMAYDPSRDLLYLLEGGALRSLEL